MVTEAVIEIHVTNTRNKGKITKSAPNFTEAPTKAPVTYSKKNAKPAKSLQHTPNYLVTPLQPNHSPIYEISDLSGNRPLDRCVELSHQILPFVPILPSGPDLSRSALITVVLFVAEYGRGLGWTEQIKALRLACWNADSVRDWKLELDFFFGQHAVPTCLLNETHLRPQKVFRFANYVSQRRDRLTGGGGTAVLAPWGIGHYVVPVQDLKRLETTAVYMLVSEPMKILAVCLLAS